MGYASTFSFKLLLMRDYQSEYKIDEIVSKYFPINCQNAVVQYTACSLNVIATNIARQVWEHAHRQGYWQRKNEIDEDQNNEEKLQKCIEYLKVFETVGCLTCHREIRAKEMLDNLNK
jgi:hypothetical protein